MPRATALLLVLLAVLGGGAAARAKQARHELPPPKLQDVRVWYYPPGQRAKPITLLWWRPDAIRVQRRMDVSRRGVLRVRVLVSGGFEEDASGTLNWVSVVFRDDSSSLFDLPHPRRETRNGMKDIDWRIPEIFSSGPLEFDVVAWSGRTPSTGWAVSQVDQLNWIQLGRVVD